MDNSDYRPIPGQTPLTLPPKPESAPVEPIPTTLPAEPTPVAPVADAPAPVPVAPVAAAPIAAKPIAAKPIASAPAIAKLPVNPKFVSPMPKIAESNDDIPSFLPVVAGIAAAVTIAFSVLIYLKR